MCIRDRCVCVCVCVLKSLKVYLHFFQISGDADEEQILTAATAYIDRPDVLQKVLNDLYHLFRFETCQNIPYALAVVLEAMDRHLTEKHIQISGRYSWLYK